MYSATQVATIFNTVRETVRNWAIEFENELSPTANPGGGRQRAFTDSDLEIVALISEMKGQGKLYADIHAALANGQRGQVPNINAAIVPVDTSKALTIDQLRGDLAATQDELKKVSGQLLEARQQRDAALEKVDKLNREIGRLEAGKKSE